MSFRSSARATAVDPPSARRATARANLFIVSSFSAYVRPIACILANLLSQRNGQIAHSVAEPGLPSRGLELGGETERAAAKRDLTAGTAHRPQAGKPIDRGFARK